MTNLHKPNEGQICISQLERPLTMKQLRENDHGAQNFKVNLRNEKA